MHKNRSAVCAAEQSIKHKAYWGHPPIKNSHKDQAEFLTIHFIFQKYRESIEKSG